MDKKTAIKDAIAHLNGYVAILEERLFIPALAVKDTIKELKKINLEETRWKKENKN